MSLNPARGLALDVVTRVREREAYAHETLDAALSRRKLNPRDSSYATRLAYGTIACRGTLDEAVSRFVTGAALEPGVADALAISAYEILFTRTPPRAAVSEGVELVRSVKPRAAGLANAVLRRLAEVAGDFPWGDPDTDVAALARLHGHPEWLAELWVTELGHEAATALMAANNEPAPLYLAHLPFESAYEAVLDALATDGAEPKSCPVPGCIQAGVPSVAVKSAALRNHQVIVADAGAQFTAFLVHPRPSQTIVELGAGRGTKSLLMAGAAFLDGGVASISAIDVHSFKLESLRGIAEQVKAKGIRTVVADATDIAAPGMPGAGSADVVLVDAPCSGLGTLRRHPDRRWRAQPDQIETLALLGARLLSTAAALVKPGGFVVYSTCTIAQAENAAVVDAFLASEHGEGFTVDLLDTDIPEQWRRFSTTQGYFQSLPEEGGTDGHFVARLKRGR
ncbi:MAG: antitermination protein NusB [Actinobacteria bacterium HGW-Actinobacteria-7]|nr:MAG: antitermination protein NusB [Actinobacteria bacterium HGW-Actinobacteria-7]